MLSGRKVAIATLWDGVPDYACAVMHYCQHAQRLADVFTHGLGATAADLLLMLTDDHMYEAQKKTCRCRRTGKRFCPECPGGDLSNGEGASGRGLTFAAARDR